MSGWWAASYVVLWLLVVVLCLVVIALARQIGTLHLRLGPRGALEVDDEGPPLGEAPPLMDAADTEGRPVAVGGPGTGQLLLFVSPGCRVCAEVLPGLTAAARAGELAPLVIMGDVVGDSGDDLERYGAPVVRSAEVMSGYDLPGTPYAVVLDEGGVVRAKGTVNNLEQLEGLVDTARRRQSETGAGE